MDVVFGAFGCGGGGGGLFAPSAPMKTPASVSTLHHNVWFRGHLNKLPNRIYHVIYM
jgi:hypothetical protein